MAREKTKTEIVQRLQERLGDRVEFALLYGSAAAGRIREHSDIDLAIYVKKMPADVMARLDFIHKLSRHFYRDIDVIFLNDCDIIITMQALANGELIINNNPGLFIRFKAQKLGEYADFKLSRRIIEEKLLKGRHHA